MAYRCDCCGKFRKDCDLVLLEEVCGDGFQVDQFLSAEIVCRPPTKKDIFQRNQNEHTKLQS